MKKIILILFVLIIYNNLQSQERYINQLIDSVTVETFEYAVKEGEKLELDIYQPFNDWSENRALVIYVHGGGFSGGTRDDANNQIFCKRLAELGYVSVSMSYRLTRKGQPGGFGCDCSASEKIKTFEAAMEDIQDATYFLIENRDMFRINPQKIILAGSSAGAEAILYAGYQPPMCYDLPSGPVSYAGLISMAGAIPDTTFLYDESAVPTMFFHGTCDNLVPYASAPHHYCEKDKKGYLMLHGAFTLSQKLQELNVPYWLHTTCGGGHEVNWIPMRDYFQEIQEFCFDYVIKANGDFKITTVPGDQNKCDYQQFDFCEE